MAKKIESFPIEGFCSCGQICYRMLREPMFVHCCHCSWCQKETGSAFVINALVETGAIELVQGEIESTEMPSNSGAGQQIIRCSACNTALWSHYGAAREKVAFVRVGTLSDPVACPPDIHIYTSTKLPWVILDNRVPVVEEYYRRSQYWPDSSIHRYKSAIAD